MLVSVPFATFPPPQNSSKFSSQNLYCLGSFPAKNESVDPATIAWEYLSGIFTTAGTAMNILVLVVVLSTPQLRRGAGFFIAHLLLCQIGLCGFVMPIVMHHIHKAAAQTLLPEDCSACRYQHFLHTTLNTLVNWSEGLLALNRLTAIFFPTKFHYITKPFVQYSLLVLTWILVLIYSLPAVFGSLGIYKMSTELGSCTMTNKHKDLAIILAINSYCPLALMAAAAVVIIGKTMVQVTVETRRNSVLVKPNAVGDTPGTVANAKISASLERRKRISTMLLMSFSQSLACQVPQMVMSLIGFSSGHPRVVLWFWFASVIQFTATPTIFLGMNKDYQQAAKLLMLKLRGLTAPSILSTSGS